MLFGKTDYTKERKAKRALALKARAKFKRDVKALDNNRCQNFATNHDRFNGISAHHIIFSSQSGKDEVSNGITLCLDCHERVHGIGTMGMSGRQYMIWILRQHVMKHDFRWLDVLNELERKEL